MSDPIVSLNAVPEASLRITVDAAVAHNQILRDIGTYRALYLGGSIITRVTSILPGESLVIEDGWTAGVIKTSSPVTVELDKDEASISILVKSILVIDAEYDQVTLSVPALGAKATVNLNYQVMEAPSSP